MAAEVTIVVGATSGIGYDLTKELLQSTNDKVMALGRRIECFNGMQVERLIPYKIDLSCSEQINSLINEMQKDEIVVNKLVYCAGLAPITRFGEIEYKTIQETYTINTFSFLYICNKLWQYNLIKEGSSIVALSSIVAECYNYSQCVYGSSKIALNYIVKNLARIFLKNKVRVNALELGCVDTPMFRSLHQSKDQSDNYALWLIPLKKVTGEILRLLSDESSHMTGSIITIDSGYLINK